MMGQPLLDMSGAGNDELVAYSPSFIVSGDVQPIDESDEVLLAAEEGTPRPRSTSLPRSAAVNSRKAKAGTGGPNDSWRACEYFNTDDDDQNASMTSSGAHQHQLDTLSVPLTVSSPDSSSQTSGLSACSTSSGYFRCVTKSADPASAAKSGGPLVDFRDSGAAQPPPSMEGVGGFNETSTGGVRRDSGEIRSISSEIENPPSYDSFNVAGLEKGADLCHRPTLTGRLPTTGSNQT